jgi:hypothetical protein
VELLEQHVNTDDERVGHLLKVDLHKRVGDVGEVALLLKAGGLDECHVGLLAEVVGSLDTWAWSDGSYRHAWYSSMIRAVASLSAATQSSQYLT